MADALREIKLIINPLKTGAASLHVKSILRITEFILVRNSGGSPFAITTTLKRNSCMH